MAVIGNTPTQQAFTPAVDYFSGNASTTAFTLSRPVASVAQVQVTVNNVAQNPSSAYTISSNTITFTSAPSSGTNNIYVYYTSPITQVIAPGQGTVNTTSLGNITNIASGNSSLTLQTGSGNTTAVTVDTSQNVGIGTTSPTTYGAKLGVVNSASSGQTWVSIINNSSTVYEGAGVLMGSNAASTNYGGTLLYHTYFTSGTQNNTAYSFNISQRSATGSYVSNIWNVDYQNNVQTWYRPNTSVAQMSLNATGVLQIGTGTSEVFAQNTVKVWGSVNSGSSAFYTSFGASSISKNSTGYFTINFTRTLSSARFGLSGAGYGGAVIFSGGNESTTSTGLRTYNDAGSLTDTDFQFILAGGSS